MTSFVVAHGLDDGAAALIIGRQSIEMALQMTFHLSLGLGYEPQAGAVAEQRGERADAKGAGIPERIEHAGAGPQLLEPGLAPGEMIGFLAGGVKHEISDIRVPREQGLRMVERLGGHLAGVVDPHEGGRLSPVVCRQGGIGFLGFPAGTGGSGRGHGAASGRGREQRAQGAVCRRDEGVQVRPALHWAGL